MWPRLNVWIMAPGDAARIDDRDGWLVFTADAHQQPFRWKGFDYTNGAATAAPGWLEYEVPPGTYVVWAERTDERTLRTHKAVVAVHDELVVIVRLLPDVLPDEPDDGKPDDRKPDDRKPDDRRPRECHLTVDDVVGYMRGGDYPQRLEIHGTASGCEEVQVRIRLTEGGRSLDGTAAVEPNGRWRARYQNDGDIRCGQTVVVEVSCVRNDECRKPAELRIRCRDDIR